MDEKAIIEEVFWLHIKKSAGQSAMRLLAPVYKEVERKEKPACFVQSPRQDWNGILNNHRVPLGEYQFKRSLFAKKFLYQERWDSLYKFAFVREPVDRCLSQFFYLWHLPKRGRQARLTFSMLKNFRFSGRVEYDFDRFLDAISTCRDSKSNYSPQDLHFQTHTAAMWDDVTDCEGNILLDDIFRVEDLRPAISEILVRFGHPPLETKAEIRKNQSKRAHFNLSERQRLLIEKLFAKDFDLFESASSPTRS